MKENIIGKRIKEYREEKNMTQQELADRVGVTWEMISRYERNESKPFYKLEEIANALNISIEKLLHDNNNSNCITVKANKVNILDKNISKKGIFKIDISSNEYRNKYIAYKENNEIIIDKYKNQKNIIGVIISQIITY